MVTFDDRYDVPKAEVEEKGTKGGHNEADEDGAACVGLLGNLVILDLCLEGVNGFFQILLFGKQEMSNFDRSRLICSLTDLSHTDNRINYNRTTIRYIDTKN